MKCFLASAKSLRLENASVPLGQEYISNHKKSDSCGSDGREGCPVIPESMYPSVSKCPFIQNCKVLCPLK